MDTFRLFELILRTIIKYKLLPFLFFNIYFILTQKYTFMTLSLHSSWLVEAWLVLAFSFCCLATACCALLKLMCPSLALPRISSSTDRFTFFETICFNFWCSEYCVFFGWIGASKIQNQWGKCIKWIHYCKRKAKQSKNIIKTKQKMFFFYSCL